MQMHVHKNFWQDQVQLWKEKLGKEQHSRL